MDIELAHFNMIEQQIRPWDVLDGRVLATLAAVRREQFVPASQQALAFVDTEIPLPDGQHMLAPKVEARLVQELQLTGTERVLEIGTGSGFMAALLGRLGREVVSVEIRPALAEAAREALRRAGPANVSVVDGDGSRPEAVPGTFDAILFSGSVANVPAEWLAKLSPGGRLVAVEGQLPVMRAVRYLQSSDAPSGASRRSELFDTVAPRLQGFAEPTRFQF
jgi:protein-L-isoaspartate(D-aspartate) O-methyltransferase